MNLKRGGLKFIIDNEDKGDAYTNIPLDKPIFPSIFLNLANDSVEILEINLLLLIYSNLNFYWII